jgi:hypothetical protein
MTTSLRLERALLYNSLCRIRAVIGQTHQENSKESLMLPKTRDLLNLRWESEANLSLFLFLLVVVGFVLPSIGVEKNNLPLYADITFSVVLVVGAAIA